MPHTVFETENKVLMRLRHDDITYQSIAKAFGLKLKLHEDALRRMKALSKPHPSQPNFSWDEPSPALEAKLRMIRLPIDESRDERDQALFVDETLLIPEIERNVEGVKVDKEEDADPSDDEDLES
ncbi:MAG: hypothetical protein Q9195_001505 [Heterodermia aff. obscurata]